MRSRDSCTQPERSKRLSSRVTISRTVPSSSASAWCVVRTTVAMAQQGLRQALVQPLEGHRLGQGHQVGQALGKDAEDETAKASSWHQRPKPCR
jgi:hypothetical protein